MLGVVMMAPFIGAGRSPHTLIRPGETDVGLEDLVGIDGIKAEVVRSINLFLAHQTFRDTMGGSARRGILFEGPPGPGKTFVAKAMAKEANVPFLFVSASAFQSMYYGQTNRKIRSFFKQLRKYARTEGGAIGFIEEIDAIGATRRGMGGSGGRGHHRRGQRAAGPAAVLRHPDAGPARLSGLDRRRQPLPARRQQAAQADGRPGQRPRRRRHQPEGRPRPCPDPAGAVRSLHLLRASRPPARADIVAYYLGKKAHAADLDEHGAVDMRRRHDVRVLTRPRWSA